MAGNIKKKAAVTPDQPIKDKTAAQSFPVNIPKWIPWAILAFTALIYSRTLQNGFTGFDDDFYVTRNSMLYDFSWHGIKVIFTSLCYYTYHPVTILVYLFEYRLYGLDPLPYHALNALLHLVNTWLVFKLAMRLSGNRLTAVIVSVLFALHPMHVESVAWVSELKDVLYAAFYLASLICYLDYISSAYRSKFYIASLFLFSFSLLSKPAAVTLPLLLIVIDIYKGRKLNMRLLAEKVPFLLLSLLLGIVTMRSFKSGGAISDTEPYGSINRIFLCTYALQSYIVRLVVPYSLSAMHHFPSLSSSGWLPWQYYPSLPFILLIVWLVARRSSMRKEILFGFSFFLVTISVMLQIISFSSHLYAERYTYIAYIGLFYVAGQWIANIGIIKWKTVVTAVFSCLVVVYSIQSWARIGAWKDSNTLFTDMIEKEPSVYFGYYQRANAEKSDGNLQAAMDDYDTAIALNSNFEDLYYNRGTLYDAVSNLKAAISDYSSSIRLNPKLPDAYNNRGWAYFRTGDTAAAIKDLDQAILLKPDYANAYNNRGWIYFQSGKMTLALQDFNKAVATNPDFDKPLYNRAALKGTIKDFKGAIEDFNTLLQMHPDDNSIYYYRGQSYLMLQDTAAACMDFKKAPSNDATAKMILQCCH